MAKSHYLERKDPSDCALYYVALGRVSSLVRLFELARETTIANFLKNDFSQAKYVVFNAAPHLLGSKLQLRIMLFD